MIGSRFCKKLGLVVHPVDWDYAMSAMVTDEAVSYKIKIGDEFATIRSKWLELASEKKDDI